MSAAVEFRQVSFGYGDIAIFKDFDFKVSPSSYVSVIGPSGVGKTTLLRLIAGLEKPEAGGVSLLQSHTSTASNVQIVFQDYSQSLLPWLTAKQNILLGLSPKAVDRAHVEALIHRMGLEGTEHRLPRELSGGMQQRVALARALASSPSILLLDEPFGAVDTPTKLDLQDQMQALWALHQLSILHVTHDLDEACYVGDEIFIIRRGGSPIRIPNPLPRPRHRLTTRESEEFLTLRRRLFEELGYA